MSEGKLCEVRRFFITRPTTLEELYTYLSVSRIMLFNCVALTSTPLPSDDIALLYYHSVKTSSYQSSPVGQLEKYRAAHLLVKSLFSSTCPLTLKQSHVLT